MPKPSPLPEIYRRLREAMGVDQGTLANKIGVTISKLSRWEANKGKLTDKQVQRLRAELEARADKRNRMLEAIWRKPSTGALTDLNIFRQLRALSGISQAELADRAGILRLSVTAFETGQMQLKAEDMEAINNSLRELTQNRTKHIDQWLSCLDKIGDIIAKQQAYIKTLEDVEESLRRELDKDTMVEALVQALAEARVKHGIGE